MIIFISRYSDEFITRNISIDEYYEWTPTQRIHRVGKLWQNSCISVLTDKQKNVILGSNTIDINNNVLTRAKGGQFYNTRWYSNSLWIDAGSIIRRLS